MKEYKLSTVIQLKKELNDKQLEICEELIQDAFDNNLGCLKRKDSEDKFKFIFEGREDDDKTDRPCLEIGAFTLKRTENFLTYVEKWDWIESDPDECCDVLKVFAGEVCLDKEEKTEREEYKLSTVIQLKKELSDEQLKIYEELIQGVFNNDWGYIKRSDSKDKFKFIFEGKEDDDKTDRPCLEIGVFTLKRTENFLTYVEKWDWIESDPDECCDVLKVFAGEVCLDKEEKTEREEYKIKFK